MTLSHLIAAIHILTFGLGFSACWSRAVALQKVKDASGLKAVFLSDSLWGVAAMLWILTGLWRAFGGLEKETSWYIHNTAFIIKMVLFALVFIVEVRPMVTLIRWRIRLKNDEAIDYSAAPALARLTWLELFLLVPIVLMATAVARGIWY